MCLTGERNFSIYTPPVPEGLFRLGGRGVEGVFQLLLPVHQADALAAAPGAGLDQHGIPDARGLLPGPAPPILSSSLPGTVGTPASFISASGRVLVPHFGDDVPVGADEGEVSAPCTAARKPGVLRQESRSPDGWPGPRWPGRRPEYCCMVEIAVRRRGRAHADASRPPGPRAAPPRPLRNRPPPWRSPISLQARIIRTAISPRLAIRIFENILYSLLYEEAIHVEVHFPNATRPPVGN